MTTPLPVTRYSTLVEKLLAFYTPLQNVQKRDQALKNTLKETHTIIMEETHVDDEDIIWMIAGRMLKIWEHQHNGSPERVILHIKEYAEYYVNTIFKEMAGGDRATLQHQFSNMAGSCIAVYHQQIHFGDILADENGNENERE